MTEHTTTYGMSITLPLDYNAAVAATRSALAEQGFGVLTEIDVAATMKKKLDVDFRPYVILGACNPPLAYHALSVERDIGLLLPCNVIVYEGDAPGTSVVAVMDPEAALTLTGNAAIADVAAAAKQALLRALDLLDAETTTAGNTGGVPMEHYLE